MNRFVSLGLFLACLPSVSQAQGIDPRGIYFNDFTGGFSGTEWFQVTAVAGSTTTFNIRDIYGGGFTATVTPTGEIMIPGEAMDGSFSGPDDFVIFPFSGQFTFTSNRVPTTTVEFPLTLTSPQAANPLLDGAWVNTLQFIDPQTGQAGAPSTEIITVTTTGDRVRITDPGGLFFQGIFEDGLNAGFRALNNPNFGTPSGIYARFPGSTTNIGQDLLGELNMIDINHFRASFLLQTRTPLGNQNQSLVEFNAVRQTPLAMGDANGDGAVDAVDEQIVISLQGITFEDSSYNLAADIDANGVIDADDQAFFGPQPVGSDYCLAAVPNSTGAASALTSVGSASVADNDLTLIASNLPANTLVLAITSQTQGFVLNPGGSQGNICLGGSVGRFVPQAGLSSSMGTFELSVDLTSMPQPTGSVAAVAGETWNFQAWHRDSVGGQSTSNFTTGRSVTFN